MRGDFFQVFGSKTKTYRLRESRGPRGGMRGQTNKTALEHMDFPHVNQYSSPDLPIEQRGQREEGAERQMRQREGCGMSCVKREILIGGKEKEDCYALRNEKKRKTKSILHAEAVLVALLHSGLHI